MMTNGKITVATAINDAVAILSLNKSIETPRLDAEVLLCSVLNCERISLVINKDKELNQEVLTIFNEYINKRAKNEPVSYIIGTKEFMSLEFDVSYGILIPRPDTEVLVEEIIKRFTGKKSKILDLCTGSGAIAVSLANYIPDAEIIAVDKYDVCLKTALKNAKKHNVYDRVKVILADVLEPLEIDESFDCIVSNPPYIKSDILPTLLSDVKDYEPMYALDGGVDGLVFYKKITEYAKNKLNFGGILAFEIGYDQGEEVKAIIENTGCFKDIKIINDLAGRNRVILAEKR